jgi:membrane protein DedA with SNARE-associated domain
MPEEVTFWVTQYGYLAIFVMVFLQEVGMPNPLPNELLLMFSGYLAFKGILFWPYVILTIVAADFIGTNILYFLFYSTGSFIMQKKPKWIPLSAGMLERLSERISKGGQLSIYIFRLTPFTRGYTSVITGIMQIKPAVFLPLALVSAITWAMVYVIAGYLIGPSWQMFSQNIANFKYIMLAVLIIVVCMLILINYLRRKKRDRPVMSE